MLDAGEEWRSGKGLTSTLTHFSCDRALYSFWRILLAAILARWTRVKMRVSQLQQQ